MQVWSSFELKVAHIEIVIKEENSLFTPAALQHSELITFTDETQIILKEKL